MTRTISKGSRRSGAEFAEATDRDARIQKALEALAAGHYNQYLIRPPLLLLTSILI